jgi:hypothetical protein
MSVVHLSTKNTQTYYNDHHHFIDLFQPIHKQQRQQKNKYNLSFVQIGTNWCKDSGIYEFTMGATGAKVKARYSFVYVYEDGQWKIAHHHSSQMPEAIQPKQPVPSDEEVRGFFNVRLDTCVCTFL